MREPEGIIDDDLPPHFTAAARAYRAEQRAGPNGSGAPHISPLTASGITAADLDALEFPPIRYVVNGYIAEGLTILAGRPKLGKSWACLDISIAVSTGGVAFGAVDCEAGDVLYAALEDNNGDCRDGCARCFRFGPSLHG